MPEHTRTGGIDTRPLVSVCVPTRNQDRYLVGCLESIIDQTFTDLEIIIGDNASEDRTEEIALSFMKMDKRIGCLRNETNLHYSGNCNRLIQRARGRYIAIFHSDDLYEPTILEKQVRLLESDGSMAGVFAFQRDIDERGEVIGNRNYYLEKLYKGREFIRVDLHTFLQHMIEYRENFLVCPTSMVRASVYRSLSGYDEGIEYVEDQDMWTRILEKHDLGIVNEKLLSYRRHGAQWSSIAGSRARDVLSHSLKYLETYCSGSRELGAMHGALLDRRIAEDHLVLARNSLFMHEKVAFLDNAAISRKYHIFRRFGKDWLVQKMGNCFGFHVLSMAASCQSASAWLREMAPKVAKRIFYDVEKGIILLHERIRGIDLLSNMLPSEAGFSEEQGHYYSLTRPREISRVLRDMDIGPEDNIADIGSGKGGVLIAASRFPFKNICGIELSEKLHEIAKRNVSRLGLGNICLINENAADVREPLDDYNYFYFYQPFPIAVFRTVMRNILDSLSRKPRKVYIIYRNPAFHDVITTTGVFKRTKKYTFRQIIFVYESFLPETETSDSNK